MKTVIIILTIIGLFAITGSSCTVRLYSQYFISGVNSTNQFTVWNTFVNSLICTSYSQLQVSGSEDIIGIILTDATMVNDIAYALRTSSFYNKVLNGCN